MAGAEVIGFSLLPNTEPSLYKILEIEKYVKSIIGDIRDLEKLKSVINNFKPEIVFHLAAQPIVRESYENPVYTYETNVMGTVNLLEAIRCCDSVRSVVNVTTDKVYKNNEWEWGYREYEPLDGFDPYSNSKSCSELVTHSFKNSFFTDGRVAISTARAGNVIGGGDFAKDRIIPDCIRAAKGKETISVRNPHSIRPYQHVLESLGAYIMIAQKQYEDIKYSGYYNVGPDECDCITTGDLVDIFCRKWGQNITWENKFMGGPHEANFLKLDCSKIKNMFGWKPKWNVEKAIEKTVDWSKCYFEQRDIHECMNRQIEDFFIRESIYVG
jgi:CDP-glucose 4,6-dehydratase